MNTNEIFNEIKNLSKEEKILLMNLVFLDSSFDISDIVKIKENELKIKLQRNVNKCRYKDGYNYS